MKKHTFTLIELLVVIAIIGILLTILMPSLSRAREVAKETLCLSQVSQLSRGITLFAKQNDNMFPDRADDTKATHLSKGSTRDYLDNKDFIDPLMYSCPLGPEAIDFDIADNSKRVESHYSMFWGIRNFYTGEKSFKSLMDDSYSFNGNSFKVIAMDYLVDGTNSTYSHTTHDAGLDKDFYSTNNYYIRRYGGNGRASLTTSYSFLDGSAVKYQKITYNDARLKGVPVIPASSSWVSLMPAAE